jgi:hypothetical protein
MDSNAKLLVLAPLLLLLQVLQTLALVMRHARARCTLSNDVIAQATTAPGQQRERCKVYFLKRREREREIESFDARSLSG